MPHAEVLCVGEVLWDSLPAGLFLGGAPFNVAGHLHALGVPVGMVSRVGADRLGTEALQRLARNGIATDIVEPAAWDFIELEEGLLGRAADAAAIVFGSLAQRSAVSRGTIERLCAAD